HVVLLALEALDLVDLAVLGGNERSPLRLRVDVDRLDRIAVDARDERGGAGARAEIDRASVEELQRVARRDRLHPAHRDAVLGQLPLHVALLLEQHRGRVVGRPVDADLFGVLGGFERGARNQSEGEHPREQNGPGMNGHDGTSARSAAAAFPRRPGGGWRRELGPALSLARAGRALAAFVERPQAASSNRRYVFSIRALCFFYKDGIP